jgi:AmpE protein
MTFIVTLIALVIERFFDWSHLRQWHWYTAFQNAVMRRVSGKSPYVALALTIIPLLILVGLLEFVLDGWLFGFARFIFDLILFIYCLGPKDLWADAFSSLGTTPHEAPLAAASSSLHHHFLDHVFVEANRRVFAVVFWYVVLGPVGAILYRAITLSASTTVSTASDVSQQTPEAELAKGAQSVESILNWIPIRIFTFLFALGGHFVQVLPSWRKNVLSGLDQNNILLSECGIAALGSEEQSKMIEDSATIEKSTIQLLDRAFVITLVVVAIVTLL